jgi:DNA repair protein RadC
VAIKDWPAEDRPREKLLHRGSAALTDADLLAIFLRTGTTGKSAVTLARELLEEFGSLKALLNADQQHFCSGQSMVWAPQNMLNFKQYWKWPNVILKKFSNMAMR